MRMTRLSSLLLLLTLSAGCQEFEGVAPPTDGLHFPVGVVVHPNGRYLYVVNSNFNVAFNQAAGGTVTVIDTDTLEILPQSTVTIGSFGGEAVLSQDARYLYVAVRGDNSVYRLDISESGRTLSCDGGRTGAGCRISGLGSDPFALAVSTVQADLEVGGETEIDVIVTTHLRSDRITAISIKDQDLTTQERVAADLIAGGSGLAVHPRTGRYYGVGRFDGRVRTFAPVVGAEGDISAIFATGEIMLGNGAGTYDARAITFSANGDRAYVAARTPSSLLVVDASDPDGQGGARDQWVGQIDLLGAPEDLIVIDEAEGEFVYVLELGSGEITVVDPRVQGAVDRFEVGRTPTAMAVDQTRHHRMYVTLFREAAVAVVDIDPDSRRYRTTVAKIR